MSIFCNKSYSKFIFLDFIWRPLTRKQQGDGVVLAHAMGLGKTIQTITTLTCFMNLEIKPKTESNYIKALVIVPVNVIFNWLAEFDKWVPESVRPFKLFNLRELQDSDRAKTILTFRSCSQHSVLIIGYEAFRTAVSGKDTNRTIQTALTTTDIVILDEAHRVKDDKSKLNETLSQIKTKRRLALTGYPLQNSLAEYFVLIDWVRPGYLGTKKSFISRFQSPIEKGKTSDATQAEKDRMIQRAIVLKDKIKPVVHRREYRVAILNFYVNISYSFTHV